jgi:four helix bundle protein
MYLKSYKDLIVWQKSIKLVKNIYNLTNQFPKDEIYGLNSQMRRAAVSIPSNIAEGYSRKNTKEYAHFLRIAYGSSTELETQIIIAKDLYKNINYNTAEMLLEEILKMLNVITEKLENKNND